MAVLGMAGDHSDIKGPTNIFRPRNLSEIKQSDVFQIIILIVD